MLRTWSIPASWGDFRLIADPEAPDARSVLTVSDPTANERVQLGEFLAVARKRRWATEIAGVAETGQSTITIRAPLAKCGPLLAGEVTKDDRGVLTLVASGTGAVVAQADNERGGPIAAAAATEEAAANPVADHAVTTRRGTVCCPQAQDGPLRLASQVLRAWCTPAQWASWVARGFLDCIGGMSGTRYRIFHRHHPQAVVLGMPTYDLDAKEVIYRWDYRVPPAEEALGAKLLLEFREHWLRNRSGAHMHDRAGLYVNPFGSQTHDGRWDATLFTMVDMGVNEAHSLLTRGRVGMLGRTLMRVAGGESWQEATLQEVLAGQKLDDFGLSLALPPLA